jgi:hypothetical protein
MNLQPFTLTADLVVALALLRVAPRVHAQEVENATFTSGIADGQPVDYRQEFPNTVPAVYFGCSQNLWASRPPAGRLLRHPWGVKLLPRLRGKAGPEAKRSTPILTFPLPVRKEPDRALETCASTAKPTRENVPR